MRTLSRCARYISVILILALALSTAAYALDGGESPDGGGQEALKSADTSEEPLPEESAPVPEPDDPATLPYILGVLCRLLDPAATVSPDELGIPADKWYAADAAAAAGMGISFDVSELEEGLFPRCRAFCVLAEAFRLIPAEPDCSVLDAFADSGDLAKPCRPAAAALVSAGVVVGDSEEKLAPYTPLTCAELETMIGRLVESALYYAPDTLTGGTVLKYAYGLRGKTYDKPLWIACGAGKVDLCGVTAGTVTALSQGRDVQVDSRTNIERLVIACHAGDTLKLNPGRVGTLVIAPGAPENVTVYGNVGRIEITADGCNVTVRSNSSQIAVSGSGNTVSLPAGRVSSLTLTDTSTDNKVVSDIYLTRTCIDGFLNSVTFRGSSADVTVAGQCCSVSGGGELNSIAVTSRTATVTNSSFRTCTYPSGAEALDFALAVPESFTAGSSITVEASATGWESASGYTLTVYVDDDTVHTETVDIAPGKNVYSVDVPIDLYDGMVAWRVIRAYISDPGGRTVGDMGVTRAVGLETLLSSASVVLKDHDHKSDRHVSVSASVTNPILVGGCLAEWYVDGKPVSSQRVDVGPTQTELSLDADLDFKPSGITVPVELRITAGPSSSAAKISAYTCDITEKLVLSTVTSTYAGNYTLEWALNHDYDNNLKTKWVNAKGYSSQTKYLIWVNRTYQRVNVFTGSKGNWTLIKTFLCGTGRKGHATPVGVSKVRGRIAKGWTHPTYNVKPVVYFLTGGYAFHSRLYDPTHSYLTDERIGFPISLGCIRMYDEDVQWIFDNIPASTTVVVH